MAKRKQGKRLVCYLHPTTESEHNMALAEGCNDTHCKGCNKLFGAHNDAVRCGREKVDDPCWLVQQAQATHGIS